MDTRKPTTFSDESADYTFATWSDQALYNFAVRAYEISYELGMEVADEIRKRNNAKKEKANENNDK